MYQIRHDIAARNTGWAAEMKAGQILRLTARTIIDFVAFDCHDYTEAFDQAPTKEESGCLYFKRGHTLLSRTGAPLATLIADGFEGLGTHDLQFGMCGRDRHKRAAEEGRLDEYVAIEYANAAIELADLWLIHLIRANIFLQTGFTSEAEADLQVCQERIGEGIAVFLNDRPSFRLMRDLEAAIALADAPQQGASSGL